MTKLFFLLLLPTLCLAGPGGVGGGNGNSLTIKKVELPLGPGGVGGGNGNSLSMKKNDLFILSEKNLDNVQSMQTVDGDVLSLEQIKDQYSFEGKIVLPKNAIIDVELVNGQIIELNQFKSLVTPSYFCDPDNFTDDCHHN